MIKNNINKTAIENFNILKCHTEIDLKLKYYNKIINTYTKLTKSIDLEINKLIKQGRGKYDYKIIKLEIEKDEVNDKLIPMKSFLEMWINSSKEYNIQYNSITKDCNKNFNTVLNKVIKLNTNYLNKYIKDFKKRIKLQKTDSEKQRLKNEFFTLIKFELNKFMNKKNQDKVIYKLVSRKKKLEYKKSIISVKIDGINEKIIYYQKR